jgi:hypothetical protein
MDILMGLFLVVFGLAISWIGIQVFFSILPVLGFLFGFFLGASMVEALLGDRFLGTVTGWIVGGAVGVVFALVSWLWWYAGVLMSAGASGAALATGLADAIGINSGFVIFLFAVIGGAAVIALAMLLDLPIYFVIVNTAIAGASVAVTGLLLLFNRVDYDELSYGTAFAIVHESWLWVLAWAAVAVVGMGRQLTLVNSVQLPSQRWTQGQSGIGAPAQ